MLIPGLRWEPMARKDAGMDGGPLMGLASVPRAVPMDRHLEPEYVPVRQSCGVWAAILLSG